jgi:hypothetical protein
MRRYKVVVENTDVVVWSGTRRECDSYIEGAHANSVNPYLAVAPAGCCCGPERQEVRRESDGTFVALVGCLTCNTWDEPVRLAALGRWPGGEA